MLCRRLINAALQMCGSDSTTVCAGLIGRIGCFLRLVCSLTGHGNPAGWNVNSNQVTFLEATTAPRGEWTPRAARHTLRRYQAPSVQCGKCGMCKCRAAATDCDPCGDTARVGSRTVEADGQSRMLDMQDVRDMLLHPCLLWLGLNARQPLYKVHIIYSIRRIGIASSESESSELVSESASSSSSRSNGAVSSSSASRGCRGDRRPGCRGDRRPCRDGPLVFLPEDVGESVDAAGRLGA